MKSHLTLEFSSDFEVVVTGGEKVKADQVLARSKKKQVKEKIPIAQILGIQNKRISSFLEVSLGSHVKKGQVLAKKANIFKNIKLLSPYDAYLESIDLKEGCLILTRDTSVGEEVENAPLDGVVEHVEDNMVTLSFNGRVIEALSGKGKRTFGKVHLFERPVDMFDVTLEVEGKIAMAQSFTDSARAKLSALGSLGIVAFEYYEDVSLSVSVSEESYKEILESLGKGLPLLILGEKKRIVVPIA